MKFVAIIVLMRYVLSLLDQFGRKRTKMKHEPEDWSNPSEHNVWW